MLHKGANNWFAIGDFDYYDYTPPTSSNLIASFDSTDVTTTGSTDPTIFTGTNGELQLNFDGSDDYASDGAAYRNNTAS